MSGWHPLQRDGGLEPNPNDRGNPSQAFPPTRPPLDTAALYYGSGCDVRLRPAVLNSLISENLALVDSVGMHYNPASLINQRTAVEYVVQKGLPKYVVLNHQGDPTNYYTGLLSPPLLNGYNNGMVLCVIPTNRNQSWIRIDVGGGWWVPVLRNDHQELEAEDWPAWVPQLIGYFNGAFYMLGICKSQVPIVLKGEIGFWIRPDGNDTTGDGTENTPGKAFRTISGCWNAVGSRYSASPTSHIALKLGVPGTYEAGYIGPYGATVSITGDPDNRSGYRIISDANNPGNSPSISVSGINQLLLRGINIVITNAAPKPNGTQGLISDKSKIDHDKTQFTCEVSNTQAIMVWLRFGSFFACSPLYGAFGQHQADTRFIGNGHTVSSIINISTGTTMGNMGAGPPPSIWYFENINSSYAGFISHVTSAIGLGNEMTVVAGCTGRRYLVSDSSVIAMNGSAVPGDTAGTIGAFSSFYP